MPVQPQLDDLKCLFQSKEFYDSNYGQSGCWLHELNVNTDESGFSFHIYFVMHVNTFYLPKKEQIDTF